MAPDWLSPSSAGGLAVAGMTAVAVVGVLAGWCLRSQRALTLLTTVAVGGIVFQLVHAIEHAAQLAYWMIHPADAPWLTPWAASAVEGLRWMCGPLPNKAPALGTEKLHLLGNTIFLGAVVAVALLTVRAGRQLKQVAGLRAVVAIQGFHVFEHIMLTASVATGYAAIGLSTGFGQLNGDSLIAYRVWFHFLINLAATACLCVAMVSLHRQGLMVWPTLPLRFERIIGIVFLRHRRVT